MMEKRKSWTLYLTAPREVTFTALYFSAPIPPTSNSLVTRRTTYLVTSNSDLDSDSLCKPEMPNFLVEGSYDAKSQ